jgi:uncharacterized protein
MPVASPCINVCRMDEVSGLCAGCFRSLEEIAAWSSIADPQRVEILARVEKRRADRDPKGDAQRCQDINAYARNES